MSDFSRKAAMPVWLAEEGWKKNVYDILKNLEKGVIPLDLMSLRVILSNDFANETVDSTGGAEKASGGIVGLLGAIASLERINGATDKAAQIVLKANTTGEFQFPPVILPPDIDTTEDVTVNLLAVMAAATDTPTIDVQVFSGVGDTEMGGATGALSDTMAKLTVTLLAANIAAYPSFLTVILVPGAHTNDEIWIRAAWIEYIRTTV